VANEFDGAERLRELVSLNTRLQRQLRQAKDRESNLVAAVMQGAREGFLMAGPMPKVKGPRPDTRAHNPEVALWDLGDWQGGKQTLTYDSKIMRERVLKYVDIAEKITSIHRSDHPVRECYIIFGGDMIESLFQFPSQVYEVDSTIFEQYATVSRLIIEVVQRALSIYERVEVCAEWGNHGRIGSKRDAIPRSDNFDRMCYEFARTLLGSQEGRLHWEDCPEDIQRLQIGNYRAIVLHGDEIGRNGFASPNTIATHVAKWQSGAYPWEFRDAYLHHFHNHMEMSLPNGKGSVYFNGSTESSNRYALEQMAAAAIPSQRLHFIDPDEGRVTEVRKIWLAK
jgi:hypothetical protein